MAATGHAAPHPGLCVRARLGPLPADAPEHPCAHCVPQGTLGAGVAVHGQEGGRLAPQTGPSCCVRPGGALGVPWVQESGC